LDKPAVVMVIFHVNSTLDSAFRCRGAAGSASLKTPSPPAAPASLTRLESALADELRVLTEIDRKYPFVSLLESVVTDTASVTPFRINTYRKQGEGHVMLTSAALLNLNELLHTASHHLKES